MITSTEIVNTVESEVIQNVIDSREIANLTIVSDGSGTARVEIAFTYEDIASPVFIGTLPEDCRVFKARLDIIEAFDEGFYLTVGDDVGEARIMTVAQNNPQLANSYIVEPDVLYELQTDISVYFGGASAAGSGRIIIYYS